MPRRPLRVAIAAGAVLFLLAVALGSSSGGAGAAAILYKDLALHADGGFQPLTLPRRGYAPISFQGEVDVSSRSGGQPLTLDEAVVYFDRDGRLEVTGLPTCAAAQVASLGSDEARAACRAAIVGEGMVEAVVGSTPLSAPLTIFNGPEEAGHPTAVLHAALGGGAAQVFAIPVPIERIPGPFRYRVTVQVPPIAAGLGSLTRIEVEIGRRFGAAGARRSYVSARCSDHILRTRGIFAFTDGIVVDGSVEKYCRTD